MENTKKSDHWLYDNCMFSFIRNFQTVFQSGISLGSTSNVESSCHFTSSSAFVVSVLDVGHSKYVVVPHYCFKLVSIFYKLIYFKRERKHEQRRAWERGSERIPSRHRAISIEPNVGLDPRNHGIRTQAEIKSQTLNWLRPSLLFSFLCFCDVL